MFSKHFVISQQTRYVHTFVPFSGEYIYKPKGRRNIGRPRKRWRDQLHLEDQGTG